MKRRAFTLIELLVVVAIIAVLIAILLPSLAQAKDRAKTVRCQSNLHQLSVVEQTYAASFDGYALPGYGGGSTTLYPWYGTDTLAPLLGVDNMDVNGTMQATAIAKVSKMLDCPAIEPSAAYLNYIATTGPRSYNGDYTYNNYLGDGRYLTTPSYQSFYFRKVSNIRPQTLVVAELHGDRGKNDYMKATTSQLLKPPAAPYDPANTGGPSPAAATPHKNNTAGNMLFIDGHVILDDPQKMLGKEWIMNSDAPINSPFPYDF